jgi:transposase
VKLAKRVAVTGSVLPDKQGRPPGGGKLAAHMAMLIGWVEAEGDITMPELAAKLLAEAGVTAHPASLSRALLVAGFTYKKNSSGIGNRTRGCSGGT